MIERRFLTVNGVTQHLTRRDQYANPLLDMFDFKNSPSLNTPVAQAAPPASDWYTAAITHQSRTTEDRLPSPPQAISVARAANMTGTKAQVVYLLYPWA